MLVIIILLLVLILVATIGGGSAVGAVFNSIGAIILVTIGAVAIGYVAINTPWWVWFILISLAALGYPILARHYPIFTRRKSNKSLPITPEMILSEQVLFKSRFKEAPHFEGNIKKCTHTNKYMVMSENGYISSFDTIEQARLSANK